MRSYFQRAFFPADMPVLSNVDDTSKPLRELANEFGLDFSDRDALLADLAKLRQQYHSGPLADAEKFARVSEAVAFVRKFGALQPIVAQPLVPATSQSLMVAGEPTTGELPRSDVRRAVRSVFWFPKITLGAVAAVCAGLMTFANGLTQNAWYTDARQTYIGRSIQPTIDAYVDSLTNRLFVDLLLANQQLLLSGDTIAASSYALQNVFTSKDDLDEILSMTARVSDTVIAPMVERIIRLPLRDSAPPTAFQETARRMALDSLMNDRRLAMILHGQAEALKQMHAPLVRDFDRKFRTFLLALFVVASLLFLNVWRVESSATRRIELLSTERGYDAVVNLLRGRWSRRSEFTIGEFSSLLAGTQRYEIAVAPLVPGLVYKLTKRGVIEPTTGAGDTFRILGATVSS